MGRADPAPGHEQGRTGGADRQQREDDHEDGADQEDSDAGVLFRPGVGASAFEGVFDEPDGLAHPAQPGRHSRGQGAAGAGGGTKGTRIVDGHRTASASWAAVSAGAASAAVWAAGSTAGAATTGTGTCTGFRFARAVSSA